MDFKGQLTYRWLALMLSAGLMLPTPADALRVAQPIDTGLQTLIGQALQGGLEASDSANPTEILGSLPSLKQLLMKKLYF